MEPQLRIAPRIPNPKEWGAIRRRQHIVEINPQRELKERVAKAEAPNCHPKRPVTADRAEPITEAAPDRVRCHDEAIGNECPCDQK